MAVNSIGKRVSRLEDAAGIGKVNRPWARLIVGIGETEDDTMAHYLQEHPGAEEHTNFIIRKIVAPAPTGADAQDPADGKH